MNKAIKSTLIAASLMATAPVFANTTASTQINTSAQVQTEQPGVISRIGQGVHNTADKVGNGIERGVDNTKEFSKDKWQDTKAFGAETSQAAKDKSIALKDKTAEKTQNLKQSTADKTQKLKQGTQDKWQKTKNAFKPESNQAELKSNANLDVNTPVGNAKAGVNAEGYAHSE
jgi:hypothetical protein